MDSLLDYMSNNDFMGKISEAIKSDAYGDAYPVSWMRRTLSPSYHDDTEWYHREVITVDNMISNRNTLMVSELYPDNPPPYDQISCHESTRSHQGYDLQDNLKIAESSLPKSPEVIPAFNLPTIPSLDELYPDKVPSQNDMIHWIQILLYNCMNVRTRKREYAETAIKLIEQHSITKIDYYCHGLIYFPDLLERFLLTQKDKEALISENYFYSMISECIEQPIHEKEAVFSIEDRTASLSNLLSFKGDHPLEIKLLPGKYSINEELYELAKSHNVHDIYYDAVMDDVSDIYLLTYVYPHMATSKISDKYTGYRDAYHCLLYGTKAHLQSLIVRWDLLGDDSTAVAARDFFSLNERCSLETVKSHVNKKSIYLA